LGSRKNDNRSTRGKKNKEGGETIEGEGGQGKKQGRGGITGREVKRLSPQGKKKEKKGHGGVKTKFKKERYTNFGEGRDILFRRRI